MQMSMKRIIAAIAMCVASSLADAAVGEVDFEHPGPGIIVRLEEITPTRNQPYAYYQQAIASIPASRIVYAKEAEYFCTLPGVEYSLVAYRMPDVDSGIRIEGILVTPKATWKYTTDASEGNLSEVKAILSKLFAARAR